MALLGSRPVTSRAGKRGLRAGNVPLVGFIGVIGLATVVIVLNLQRIRQHSTNGEVFYLDVRPSGHRWSWDAAKSTKFSGDGANVEVVLVHDPSDKLDDVDALYKFLQQGEGLDVVEARNASGKDQTVATNENSTKIDLPVVGGPVSTAVDGAPEVQGATTPLKQRRHHHMRRAIPGAAGQPFAAPPKKVGGQLDKAQVAEIFQQLSRARADSKEGKQGGEGEGEGEGEGDEEGGGFSNNEGDEAKPFTDKAGGGALEDTSQQTGSTSALAPPVLSAEAMRRAVEERMAALRWGEVNRVASVTNRSSSLVLEQADESRGIVKGEDGLTIDVLQMVELPNWRVRLAGGAGQAGKGNEAGSGKDALPEKTYLPLRQNIKDKGAAAASHRKHAQPKGQP